MVENVFAMFGYHSVAKTKNDVHNLPETTFHVLLATGHNTVANHFLTAEKDNRGSMSRMGQLHCFIGVKLYVVMNMIIT